MTRRTPLLGILLIALLASLPAHGWAQGTMARIAGALVVCGKAGVDTVHLDWRGEPVDLPADCPDCAPAFGLGALPAPVVVAAPLGHAILSDAGPRSALRRAHARGLCWPRAPPV